MLLASGEEWVHLFCTLLKQSEAILIHLLKILREILILSRWYLLSFSFQISTVTGDLRYADAMRQLYTLEDASKGYGDTVALLR